MLGQVIAERRKGLGLSQEQLASQASVSSGTIAQIELGMTESPRTSTLQQIANALGVSVGWLLREAGLQSEVDEEIEQEVARFSTRFPQFVELFNLLRAHPDKLAELFGTGQRITGSEERGE